jgi:hypothetical protein
MEDTTPIEERSDAQRLEPANAGAILIGGLAAVSIPQWYWVAWILLGFGIPEAIALFNRKGTEDTLSEHVRRWFATDVIGRKNLSAWAKIRRILLAVGMSWLFIHWMTNGTFF